MPCTGALRPCFPSHISPAGDQAEYEAAIASIVAAVAPAQAAAAAAAAAASGAGAGGGEEGCLDGPPMQMVAKQLQPTTATANATLLGTNVLHDIDAAAQVGRAAQCTAYAVPLLRRFLA